MNRNGEVRGMRSSGIRRLIGAVAATGLGVGMVIAAAPTMALADYGPTAVYQIELSANLNGQSAKILGGSGGGVWLWIELNSNHTGDYKGADCGHNGGGAGAASDTGNVTWQDSGGMLTINGVILNGLGGFPSTVTVPDTFGHYTGTVGTFLTLPFPPFITSSLGTSQAQVAP